MPDHARTLRPTAAGREARDRAATAAQTPAPSPGDAAASTDRPSKTGVFDP